MKKYLFLIALFLCALPGLAQDSTDRFLQLSLSGDYKSLYYPDGRAPSLGYTASLDYVNKHFIIGTGFDNGVRNASMTQYNTYLFLKGGYVFQTGRFRFVPYLRAGWFMDVKNIGNTMDIYGYHQLLATAGVGFVYNMTDWIFLTASAESLMTSLAGNGFSLNAGIIFPLYYLPEKKGKQSAPQQTNPDNLQQH